MGGAGWKKDWGRTTRESDDPGYRGDRDPGYTDPQGKQKEVINEKFKALLDREIAKYHNSSFNISASVGQPASNGVSLWIGTHEQHENMRFAVYVGFMPSLSKYPDVSSFDAVFGWSCEKNISGRSFFHKEDFPKDMSFSVMDPIFSRKGVQVEDLGSYIKNLLRRLPEMKAASDVALVNANKRLDRRVRSKAQMEPHLRRMDAEVKDFMDSLDAMFKVYDLRINYIGARSVQDAKHGGYVDEEFLRQAETYIFYRGKRLPAKRIWIRYGLFEHGMRYWYFDGLAEKGVFVDDLGDDRIEAAVQRYFKWLIESYVSKTKQNEVLRKNSPPSRGTPKSPVPNVREPVEKVTVNSAHVEKVSILDDLHSKSPKPEVKALAAHIKSLYESGGKPSEEELKRIRNYLYMTGMRPQADHFRVASASARIVAARYISGHRQS